MARAVVLYRNLNQGQRGMPTTAQLRECLAAAGAQSVATFQSNGTVVIEANDPQSVTAAARPLLTAASGWSDVGVVVDLEHLRSAVSAFPAPFTGSPDGMTVYQDVLAFVTPSDGVRVGVPWWSPRQGLVIHSVDVLLGMVHATAFLRGNGSSESLTATLERDWKISATTRTRGTVERLLARSGPAR